jgi:hypothetical protein
MHCTIRHLQRARVSALLAAPTVWHSTVQRLIRSNALHARSYLVGVRCHEGFWVAVFSVLWQRLGVL